LVKGNLKLTADNHLKGTINHRRSYCENPFYKLSKQADNINTLLMPGIEVNDIESHTLETLDNKKLSASYKIDKEVSPEKKGNYLMLKLPKVNSALMNDELSTLVAERNAPFEIQWPISISYNYIIELPKNLELRNKSIDIKESSENEKVKVKINQKANKIHVLRHLEIKNKTIKPGSFNTFKDAINIWQKPNYRTLVLKRTNKK
jgi:hypothetical protein